MHNTRDSSARTAIYRIMVLLVSFSKKAVSSLAYIIYVVYFGGENFDIQKTMPCIFPKSYHGKALKHILIWRHVELRDSKLASNRNKFRQCGVLHELYVDSIINDFISVVFATVQCNR